MLHPSKTAHTEIQEGYHSSTTTQETKRRAEEAGGTVGTLLSSDTRTPKWLAQTFWSSGDRPTLVWVNPNAI